MRDCAVCVKNIVEPEFERQGGRLVNTMGDGLLVEFPSPVHALRASINVQSAVAEQEAVRPDDQRIAYRVGINLGDVVIDGTDILGDGVNIAARLEGLAEPGGHVWAERFEETGDDILALQDSVISKIVQFLIGSHGAIREDEYAKTWVKAAAELEEYDYYLRGHSIFFRFTPDAMAQAATIWKEGLKKYPDSGLLKVKLSIAYYLSKRLGFPANQHPYETTLALGLEGMADPKLPPAGHRYGLWLLSNVNSEMGRRAPVVDFATRAIKSYPFDAFGMLVLAGSLTRVGEYDFADQLVSRGLKLGFRPNAVEHGSIGHLRYAQNDCTRAIERFKLAVQDPMTILMWAGCAAENGQIDEAMKLLEQAQNNFGILSAANFPASVGYMPGVTERLTAQMASVGWPEK